MAMNGAFGLAEAFSDLRNAEFFAGERDRFQDGQCCCDRTDALSLFAARHGASFYCSRQ
jgi:hypothetical protein